MGAAFKKFMKQQVVSEEIINRGPEYLFEYILIQFPRKIFTEIGGLFFFFKHNNSVSLIYNINHLM